MMTNKRDAQIIATQINKIPNDVLICLASDVLKYSKVYQEKVDLHTQIMKKWSGFQHILSNHNLNNKTEWTRIYQNARTDVKNWKERMNQHSLIFNNESYLSFANMVELNDLNANKHKNSVNFWEKTGIENLTINSSLSHVVEILCSRIYIDVNAYFTIFKALPGAYTMVVQIHPNCMLSIIFGSKTIFLDVGKFNTSFEKRLCRYFENGSGKRDEIIKRTDIFNFDSTEFFAVAFWFIQSGYLTRSDFTIFFDIKSETNWSESKRSNNIVADVTETKTLCSLVQRYANTNKLVYLLNTQKQKQNIIALLHTLSNKTNNLKNLTKP
eukprot:2598_1